MPSKKAVILSTVTESGRPLQRTTYGPLLLGAAALHAVSELTREIIGEVPGISLVLYGALLVVMVMFLPRGLAGLGERLFARRRPKAGETGHA